MDYGALGFLLIDEEKSANIILLKLKYVANLGIKI